MARNNIRDLKAAYVTKNQDEQDQSGIDDLLTGGLSGRPGEGHSEDVTRVTVIIDVVVTKRKLKQKCDVASRRFTGIGVISREVCGNGDARKVEKLTEEQITRCRQNGKVYRFDYDYVTKLSHGNIFCNVKKPISPSMGNGRRP